MNNLQSRGALAGMLLALAYGGAALVGQGAPAPPTEPPAAAAPKATREDELALQIVVLKSRLSQTLAMVAKCEADGSQASQVAQEANAAAAALMTSLDARGLALDSRTGTIVPKPKAADPPKVAAPIVPATATAGGGR